MTWRVEKNGEGQDLVYSGFESGVALSPLKGTANIQNANISTEMGEIMASYARVQQAQTAITGGTLTASVSDGAITLAGPANLQPGQWINISSTTISPVTYSVNYLVVAGGGGAAGGLLNTTIGGGGGAGGMKTGSLTVATGAYAITVGAGGAGGTSAAGTNGSNSSIAAAVVSTGGGGGGFGEAGNGVAGGSGGGGGSEVTPGTGGAASPAGQGNAGGAGFGSASAGERSSGGGGGAGAVGGAGIINAGGAGGAGSASSISGASVTYAAGGAGWSNTQGSHTGTAGTANRGNGGEATLTNPATAGGAGGSGIVIVSYTTGSFTATGGTITYSGGNTIHTFTTSGTFTVTAPPFATGNWYVSYKDSNNKVKLSSVYDPSGAFYVSHGTSGTATFSTVTTVGSPIAKATEKYQDSNSTEYRYYILDDNNYIWVYDTAVYAATLLANGVGQKWFLPDITSYSTNFNGMCILNGWLHVAGEDALYVKPTVDLGRAFVNMGGISFLTISNSTYQVPHYLYVGHQGKMYYTDGNYIGEVFPTTSLESGIANVQSYSKYTAVTTNIYLDYILSGSVPASPGISSTRIPAVFFTDTAGTAPTSITVGTVYYIGVDGYLTGEYEVFDAITGGSAKDMQTGASGNQYFNTYYPATGSEAAVGQNDTLVTWTSQRVNLPTFETATCMVEVGNIIIIGGITNTLYPWNQVDATPSDLISLPEAGVKTMINVNNMAYVFAGNKGNIYITNSSVASLMYKVSDYCAGVPGTPNSYIEPYFTWGDAEYIRGRVYFSILDQTATKAGNCGGVWSFVPTQNFSYGQDTGIALRLENQNSYGSYNGLATIILANQDQKAIGPQYWAGWQNSYTVATSTLFGIDFTDTIPVTSYVFETDLIPIGTYKAQFTFQEFEFKFSTPLAAGDSIALYWRKNATDAWVALTGQEAESSVISGEYNTNFENAQWLQLRAVVTTNGTSTSSFGRLTELRVK